MRSASDAPDNVLLNKAAIIERALKRMKQEYHFDPELKNYTHIDAMMLNIERACQAAIDAAQHIVSCDRLGMPQNSAEAFILLEQAGIIETEIARNCHSALSITDRFLSCRRGPRGRPRRSVSAACESARFEGSTWMPES